MSAASLPQGANCSVASLRQCPCETVSFRPASMLADALFEPWLRPARMDVSEGGAAAPTASVGAHP